MTPSQFPNKYLVVAHTMLDTPSPLSIRLLLVLAFACISYSFAARADDFPAPFNTESREESPLLSAQAALEAIELPPGFRSTLFAAEPDVQNPIAMTWDARGRLWIAENYTYGENSVRFELGLRDRVLIFEDSDQDGRFDRRTVFTDQVQMLSSIAVGHGGIWLLCPPRLLFIPDVDRDDVPDSHAQVVLDGFHVAERNYHNFANGLKWGPDGWLYGRCGIVCPGELGVPGTPAERRVPIRGGMWRFHPILKRVEVLNAGTTNPWGHDWNSMGECFFINTVNGHFWHSIPGAHYQSNIGVDSNPRVYQLMAQHADHYHFDTGLGYAKARGETADNFGGGHAHSGGMIYLGKNWPEQYRDRFFTINFHGRRLNQELIERHGSGYLAKHGKDLLQSRDNWFRGIDLSYGPDGGVTIIDWSDTGECHEHTGVHRTSGRIFKVTYEASSPLDFSDLRDCSDEELVEFHLNENEWFTRQSRLILTERHHAGKLDGHAKAKLHQHFLTTANPVIRVRTSLTLFCIEDLSTEFLLQLLSDSDEHLRVWAVRMLTDKWHLDGPLGPVTQLQEVERQREHESSALMPDFVHLAENDASGLVRLALASTLQRMPTSHRGALARALVIRPEDAEDANLPLLVWYGLIAVADFDSEQLLPICEACTWPLVRRFIARRLAEDIEKHPETLSKLLMITESQSPRFQEDILLGLAEGLKGWRKVSPPAYWGQYCKAVEKSSHKKLSESIQELKVVFGDGRALDEMKGIAKNPKLSVESRLAALRILIEQRPADLQEICSLLIRERYLVTTAAHGLSFFDTPEVAETLIASYRIAPPDEQPKLISLLVSRPHFAELLLAAVSEGRIPVGHITSYHVRQIHSHNDATLSQIVTNVWGEIRNSPENKIAQLTSLRTELDEATLQKANLSHGRLLFNQNCAKCHRLYGEGETIGPDLTGSNRNNLDYLLSNIIDPSAVVSKDFRMSVIAMSDGRVLNGVIVEQTDRTLTLQGLTERMVLDRTEVEELQVTPLSPMPEGLLEKLGEEERRDLIAYLMTTSQVPLP